MLPDRLPPARNAFNGELARVVTRAHVDETNIVVDCVNAIWRDFPQFFQGEVMVKHLSRLLFRSVFAAVVLEVPYVLFFIRVLSRGFVQFFEKIFSEMRLKPYSYEYFAKITNGIGDYGKF
jgi:hypothetical protein